MIEENTGIEELTETEMATVDGGILHVVVATILGFGGGFAAGVAAGYGFGSTVAKDQGLVCRP
jgi:lactobin A/cerein 7B family class IIb bacteriocin